MTASRTTRVERFVDGTGAWYLKTYRYDGLRALLRGAFRNTFLAPSRVARELRALEALAEAGVQPDLEAEIREERIWGWLRSAQILTRDFGGMDLAKRLADEPGTGGLDADGWRALGAFVRALHKTGLRDPDLKARNILVRRRAGDHAEDRPWEFAKIDASSSRLAPPSRDAAATGARILFDDLARCGADEKSLTALREGLA